MNSAIVPAITAKARNCSRVMVIDTKVARSTLRELNHRIPRGFGAYRYPLLKRAGKHILRAVSMNRRARSGRVATA
jgi:hypothetical protein